ncbi:DICT sensory domain-containing protein [Pseudonocardia sp. KRD291]|uniref:sensor domain-containing diguanylate cyclase n=1 Tax=Pseudonocardia sp. KRD291 TaxID=2792007 RepID=UPI001C4A4C74|nr:DICT sensory domain-containing protein [Pseudonocardia sp. KRD291]MBW0101363.1 diguanylate cyclase [Pseudonocardia sp. KRD291]
MLRDCDPARGLAPSGTSLRTVTKPLLVATSHAIEEFALASARDAPLAVVAMFQRPSYFEREADLYARIARVAEVTVIGLVGDVPPRLPPGVSHVLLGEDDPLAREWSVTVLSPRSGATLVARDLEQVDGAARSLERGRLFSGRWSFRRGDAYTELMRLRTTMGSRMTAGQNGALDEVLGRVVAIPGTETDTRHDAATTVLLTLLSEERRRADHIADQLDDVSPGAERDPRSGLATRAFLDRWTDRSATGTLPLGLVLLRVHELAGVRHRFGFRAELAILQSVARILRQRTGPADRAVRVGREEFLLVLPSRDVERLAEEAARMQATVSALSGTYPFVPTPATAVITRTRTRPLPLGELWAALDRATEAGIPVTVLRARQ